MEATGQFHAPTALPVHYIVSQSAIHKMNWSVS